MKNVHTLENINRCEILSVEILHRTYTVMCMRLMDNKQRSWETSNGSRDMVLGKMQRIPRAKRKTNEAVHEIDETNNRITEIMRRQSQLFGLL